MKLVKELRQTENLAKEEKLKHDIDYISNNIDERIQEEQGCERKRGCEMKRTFSNALKGKKRVLVTELCQMERSTNEDKPNRDIDCISNDIDERIHEERGQHKACCELAKTHFDLALKQVMNQDRRPEEVKSRVCHNCNCKKARNSANVQIQDLEEISRANAEDIAHVSNAQKASILKRSSKTCSLIFPQHKQRSSWTWSCNMYSVIANFLA